MIKGKKRPVQECYRAGEEAHDNRSKKDSGQVIKSEMMDTGTETQKNDI